MTLSEKFAASSAEYFSRLEMSGLSKETISTYRASHKQFQRYLDESGESDVYAAVVGWRKALSESGVKPTTVRQRLKAIRSFFRSASRKSYPESMRFPDDVIDDDLVPKVPERRPYEVILTDRQVKLLFDPDPPDKFYQHQSRCWERNWAMIQILLNEKLRNAELLSLRFSDIDFAEHLLIVRSGKGQKYREVDLCDLSEYALRRYFASGSLPAGLTEEDYVFGSEAAHFYGNDPVNHPKERWHRGSKYMVSDAVERAIYNITGVHDVRSHDLRRIGSRICLNAGQSMEELQGQLGHSMISTTQIYCSRMGSRRMRGSAREVLEYRDELGRRLLEEFLRDAPSVEDIRMPAPPIVPERVSAAG